MKCKRLQIGFFVFLCAFLLVQGTALAAGEPTFSLSISNDKPAKGEMIQVAVQGHNLSDVYAYEVNLDVDPSLLTLKEAKTDIPGFSVKPIIKDRHIQIAHTRVGNVDGDNGDLTLFTLSFEAVNQGKADITLQEVKLVNSQLSSSALTSGAQVAASIGNPAEAVVLHPKVIADAGTRTGVATIDTDTWQAALQEAKAGSDGLKRIRVILDEVSDVIAYMLQLDGSALSAAPRSVVIEIVTPTGTMTVTNDMFRAGELPSGLIGLKIGKAEISLTDTQQQDEIGSRPVIDVHVEAGGQTIAWSNPDAPITVGIPYQPAGEEQQNPDQLVIWHVKDEGEAEVIVNGRYKASTGSVTFSTTHLSKFAVAYVNKSFEDVDAYDWAKQAVQALAARGIVNGTSESTFSPEQPVTRADFVVLLMRALELKGDSGVRFADVQEGSYYDESLAAARSLGIVEGDDNNEFHPQSAVTREDMMVLADRALQASGRIPAGGELSSLGEFTDTQDISTYAINSVANLVRYDLAHGYDQGIHPKETTNRAQAAVLIYNIFTFLHE